VTHEFHVLLDSDAFVAIYLPDDANHDRAMNIFATIQHAEQNMVTTSWVIAETATVLSNRDGQEKARAFLQMIADVHFDSIHITEDFQQEATTLFISQQKKRTSMVDCGNAVVMHRFAIPTIFSFDAFYPKHCGLTLIAEQ
jgi:predicted nucleic acid-binding protein